MNSIFAGFLGGWEWIVILLAVLLLFGAKRIPELAKGLGSGIREFKKAAREVTDEVNNAAENAPTKPAGNGQSQPPETVSQSTPPKS